MEKLYKFCKEFEKRSIEINLHKDTYVMINKLINDAAGSNIADDFGGSICVFGLISYFVQKNEFVKDVPTLFQGVYCCKYNELYKVFNNYTKMSYNPAFLKFELEWHVVATIEYNMCKGTYISIPIVVKTLCDNRNNPHDVEFSIYSNDTRAIKIVDRIKKVYCN